MNPCITVVMPAYNAQATIETALKSIRMQTVADQIEILVIDGGSTDATREIALRYGAAVLDNPRRLPEPAKQIGVQNARGKYVVFQDSDEELLSPDQLENRIRFFEEFPYVKCLVIDRQYPGKDGGSVASYYCACGDPFTWFIYQFKERALITFSQNCEKKGTFGCVLQFSPGALTPIGDGGTAMIDLDWVKKEFPKEWDKIHFACSVVHRVIQKTGYCGCIPDDDIVHHVQTGFMSYLSKLRFRVTNNLFHKQESGFSARTQNEGAAYISRRKYLFVLYAATLIGPLVDSVRLAWHYRDPRMLFHIFYLYYVCFYVAYCVIAKFFGKKFSVTSYGK